MRRDKRKNERQSKKGAEATEADGGYGGGGIEMGTGKPDGRLMTIHPTITGSGNFLSRRDNRRTVLAKSTRPVYRICRPFSYEPSYTSIDFPAILLFRFVYI